MAIQLTMAEIGLERLVLPNTRTPSGCGTIYTLFSAVEVDSLFYEYFIEDRVYFNNHYGIKGVVNERFSGKWLAIVVSICKTKKKK